jgi:hypothetical protein
MVADGSSGAASPVARVAEVTDTRSLFHRLNNQLGTSLAHAELLEAKAADEAHRLRAAQVIKSILDAMGTAREIRTLLATLPAD